MLMQAAARQRNKEALSRVQSDMAAAKIVIQVKKWTLLLNECV